MKLIVPATAALTCLLSPQAFSWTPGTYASPMHSKNLSVDPTDRNDVIAFWHAIYQASEGYQNRVAWTGDYTSNAGTTATTFVKDVERRVNFYRALCGSVGDVSVNDSSAVVILGNDNAANKPSAATLKSTANQAAAYMITRSYMANKVGPSHAPVSNGPYVPWSAEAWNGCARSNLAFGYYGPGAITSYMRENDPGTNVSGTSSWNTTVGHRRWILNLAAGAFGTGDIPGLYVSNSDIRPPANALYVLQNAADAKVRDPRFMAYPAAGYFPAPLNTPYWSLSYPGANFTNAAVVMKNSQGQTISTTKNLGSGSYGDPALIWTVNDTTATVTSFLQDTTYSITVTGITGAGVPASHAYTVTLINPDSITSPQVLSGSGAPPSASSAAYTYTAPAGAEAVQVNVFQNSSAAWTETAEAVSTTIIDRTSGTYDLRSSAMNFWPVISGSKSFRLTHPVRYDFLNFGVPEQSFELAREILPPAAGSGNLTFKYRRGLMTTFSRLVVETTKDDGATWTQLGNPINGTGDTAPETSTSTWTTAFPASTTPYRVRFRFYKTTNGLNDSTYNLTDAGNQPNGIFIDDITTTNCSWLNLKKTNELSGAATRFVLNAASAGEAGASMPNGTNYLLRMRTRLGNRWFQYGTTKSVTATTSILGGIIGWLEYDVPELVGGILGDDDGDGLTNLVEYAFNLDPLAKNLLTDTVTLIPAASSPKSGVQAADSPAQMSISQTLAQAKSGVGYGAEWSETMANGSWTSSGVTVTFGGGKITATAPAGSNARFMRWKITTL